MSASGWLIAGLVGAGGLAYVLYKRAATPATPADDCAPLKALNPQAYIACESAKAALNILGDVAEAVLTTDEDFRRADATNRALNGPVAVAVAPELARASAWTGGGSEAASGTGYLMAGTVLQFGSGCVPYADAPGWSKCKPGTQDMTHGSRAPVGHLPGHPPPADTLPVASPADLMTGVNDGSEHVDIATWGDITDASKNFPLAIPAGGSGYWLQGKPYVCPAGTQSNVSVRNHTGRAPAPGCQPLTAPPPHQINDNPDGHTGTRVDSSTNNPPPGFTWVAMPTGHWERLRAGQTPVPRPSQGVAA